LSVSCTATNACTAVGCCSARNGPLIERWDGAAWTIQPAPGPAGMRAVSCSAAAACTAAGFYFDANFTTRVLADRWDGATWTIQPPPAITNSFGPVLYGVSCSSASDCDAVGTYEAPGAQVTLAERYS